MNGINRVSDWSIWNFAGPSCSKHRYLNKLVTGHFVNCFGGFNIQYSDIFCWKNVSSFCTAKSYSHFFSKTFQHICVSLDVNFNESLTNDIVSFEQLGLDVLDMVWVCMWFKLFFFFIFYTQPRDSGGVLWFYVHPYFHFWTITCK